MHVLRCVQKHDDVGTVKYNPLMAVARGLGVLVPFGPLHKQKVHKQQKTTFHGLHLSRSITTGKKDSTDKTGVCVHRALLHTVIVQLHPMHG